MVRIGIITEGNLALGLGHVCRMLTLARTLSEVGEVIFFTDSEKAVRQKIAASGYRVAASNFNYREALGELHPFDVVIIDRLHVEESFASWLRKYTDAKLAIFGNVSEANRHAHLVVNAIMGTRFENRRFRNPASGALHLEGPRYVILGEAFRNRRNAYMLRSRPKSALLLFGGSDQANLTCRVVQRLREVKARIDLTACVGPLYPYGEELGRIASKASGSNVRVIWNSDVVWELMLEADVIATSPGNSLFEAFCLGVPAVAFFQTTHQAHMFRGFPCCFESEKVEAIYNLIGDIHRDYKHYRSTVDLLALGEGYDEIVAELKGFCG